MFILTEKIAPIPLPQAFDDNVAEDTARIRRADDERWIKRIIDGLAGILR
jgi:hypothetical protein